MTDTHGFMVCDVRTPDGVIFVMAIGKNDEGVQVLRIRKADEGNFWIPIELPVEEGVFDIQIRSDT